MPAMGARGCPCRAIHRQSTRSTLTAETFDRFINTVEVVA